MNLSSSLEATAQALLASGKGLLAADESLPTIEKRFEEFQIPSNDKNRRAYREMLFATPGLSKFISGVILFDETLRQKMGDVLIPSFLSQQGIIPGIKVDKGTVGLPGFTGEKITLGLDGLPERLAEYQQLGARFTKWRAVISIGEKTPSPTCISANAHALALFAAMSQEAGLVPMVEPEIIMDGPHTLARCEEVTRLTLDSVFEELVAYGVVLEQMLLKTSMIISGSRCPEQAGSDEVGVATLRCLRRSVPAAVPGIVFLSGGQSDESATERLDAICRLGSAPWKMSFSFGRALQAPALQIWQGHRGNVSLAQSALLHRAKCNSLATQGKYSTQVEYAVT